MLGRMPLLFALEFTLLCINPYGTLAFQLHKYTLFLKISAHFIAAHQKFIMLLIQIT
jgi:hypothetical protein